jgi:4-amino-4-deoxy-L-arabinose transferase-like glycosyltransferase
MSLQKQAYLAFGALVALSLLVLFWGLDAGRINIYDEGLYGMYGRTLLRYGVYLHAVDIHGAFPAGIVKFSKPPLSVWAVAASFKLLGPSLFALRLPFALASLAVTLLAFAFGRLLEAGPRGVWLGFAWGVAWLICYGTYEHGRTATIEPMLLAFVMAALYAYARAQASPGRGLGWAALAGLMVGGAFFTKQLVCAIAVIPMFASEWRLRHSGPRGRRYARLAVALGVPGVLAGGWFALLYAKVGFDAFRVLWNHAIVRRVSGFDGVHHQNYLNRVAELLETDATPFSWQLGLLGLGLLWLDKTRRRRSEGATPASGSESAADGVWLIGLWFVCSWLAFDVGSRAILPWYALTLLPPLALGHAWLCVRAIAYVLEPRVAAVSVRSDAPPAADSSSPVRLSNPPTSSLDGLIAASGAVALALTASLAARGFMPSLLAIAFALWAIVYCLRVPPPSAARIRLLLAAFGGMLVVGTFLRDAYRGTDTDPLASLGEQLWKRGKLAVSVSARAQVHPYALTTFFGADAEDSEEPPWARNKEAARKVEARVEPLTWPSEVVPRKGVEVLRDAGILAWVGDMTEPPYKSEDISAALSRGKLTFEAEHMAGDRFYTLTSNDDASGKRARTAEQRLLERAEEFSLAKGHLPELPRGRYIATFWLKLRCTGYRGESLGEARVLAKRMSTKRKALDCRIASKQDTDTYNPLELPFTLANATPIDLEVRWNQGYVSLDRVTIAREIAPPPPPPPPAEPPPP